jgi:hypothetical protein
MFCVFKLESSEGEGVEKYVSPMGLADDGCGDTGAPFKRSGKTDPLMSRAKGLPICGGPMMDVCHIELVAAVAVWWFEPSTMTSLIPL